MTKHLCSWAAGGWLVERVYSAKDRRRCVLAGVLLYAATIGIIFSLSGTAVGQLVNLTWVPTGTADYADGANWQGGLIPDSAFSEIAVINNGGTAFVASVLSPDTNNAPGGIILGQAAMDSGTLEVRNGGSIEANANATASPTATLGTTVVGGTGQGTLRILRGGTLISDGALTLGGSANSLLHLGESGGSGTASLTVNAASNLNRITRITGPNVNYTTNSLALGAEHNLIAEITGPNHSPIHSNGTANLDGALTVEFNGETPSPGDAWDLVDAQSITGGFNSVTSNVAVSEPGYSFFLETVPGGMNGRVARLLVDTRIQLTVNRATGAASFSNLTTSANLGLDGYLITSASGRLTPGSWDSFEDGGQANWEEANPTENSLSEINLTDSRMVGPGASIDLGNILSQPSALGVEEDLVFQYNVPGMGPVAGLIEYTGPQNNLVLIVDPATGEAALQNQSAFDIDLDGYQIISNSASLDPAGWASLSDDGMAGWEEANPTANSITEVNLDASTHLAGRSSAIDLGTIFDTNGEQDLVLHYNIAGIGPMLGIVDYGEIPDMTVGIPGDFNDSGLVEQGDLDLVLGNWGSDTVPGTWTNDPPEGIVDQAELDKVLGNWGRNMPGLGTAAGVPEPSSIALLLVVAGLGLGARLARKR